MLEIQTSDQIEAPWTAWFLYGPMGCIGGDQHVPYVIRDAEGRTQNKKGGSIERLFYRFHGKRIPGKGSYQRPQTVGSRFFVACMDENRRMAVREIGDVTDSGVKRCFRVTTVGGRQITTTKDHRFATPHGFVPLSELAVGAGIMVHTGKVWSVDAEREVRTARPQVYVKAHPHAPTKTVVDAARAYVNEYKRLPRSRAVVEAGLNRLSLEAYVAKLNANELGGLEFLDPGLDVHHRDENPLNDTPENLMVLSHVEHARLHGNERGTLGAVHVAEEDSILAIEDVGEMPTYDITMKDAPHNFVCQGFVVHNSGKTRAASTFPRPLFILPANEGSELTLAQFASRKIPFIRVGKRPDGSLVRARDHLSQILAELEKRHEQMRRLLDAAGVAADAGDDAKAKTLEAEADVAFPWQTIVMDSLTHLGDLLVEDVSDYGRKKMDQQGWGLISTFFRTTHSRLRNLECHVVYTSLAKTMETDEGKITGGGPALIGATSEKLPSACDVVVYMEELQGVPNKDGIRAPVYRSFMRKYKFWQARSRFEGFPDFVDDFRFDRLINDKTFPSNNK